MTIVNKTYTFVDGQVAEGTEVNKNFDDVYNNVNGNLDNTNIKANAAIADSKLSQITTGGKVSGAALTDLASIPSGAGVIPVANVPVGYITTGGIIMWSGTVAAIPSGWLLCNGDLTSKTTYATLYGICGTIHGAGDANNFNVPDLRDRFIAGVKQDDSGVPKTNITGSLTQSGNGSIPAHVHASTHCTGFGIGNNFGYPVGWNDTTYTGSINSGSYGTGTTNIAVYYALAFIIKT